MEFGYEATGGMVSGGWWAELEVCVQEEEEYKVTVTVNVLGVISTGPTRVCTHILAPGHMTRSLL